MSSLAKNISLILNDCGYLSASPLPSEVELRQHYANKYYSEQNNQYQYSYTDEELEHKNLTVEEALFYASPEGGAFLELGCGEGFLVDGFARAGWSVKGVDFTDEGINKFFPQHAPNIVVGDLFKFIDDEVESDRRYDFIACNNVLEHVIDPVRLLHNVRRLLNDGGIARIMVPNDGGWLHTDLIQRNYVPEDFYVAYPGHLHYFTRDSLLCLVEACGLKAVDVLGDFPIDTFLYNEVTNYVKDQTVGRKCHFARVQIELGMRRHSFDGFMAYRRGCAQAGMGRNIIVYITGGES